MSLPQLGLAVFAISLPLGSLAVAIPLGIRARRLGGVRAPALPTGPSEPLVLLGSEPGVVLKLVYALGCAVQVVTLVSSFVAGKLFPPAPGVAIVAVLALILLGGYLDARTARRLELDEHGFLTGKRRVLWVHLTELHEQDGVIRYRVNRALVKGSPWRYWDGAIRNGWGVESDQLLHLFESYRRRALDAAPGYLTGRREGGAT